MTINVKVTLNGGVPFASQSLAANTASYAFNAATASFLSAVGLVPSASFANNSLVANTATLAISASSVNYSNITNLPTLISSSVQINTGSFSGSITNALSALSASYALTASFALNGGSGGGSASFATTASFASSIPFGSISALPTLVSSSAQVDTGSFTGSFIGNGGALTGIVSSSYAITASNASSIQFSNISALPTLVSSSGQISYPAISNIPTGIVSSSAQINTGSFTGSFIGTHTGNGAGLIGVVSSAYAVTSSFASSVPYSNITALPTLVSSSGQISYAGLVGIPTGIVSSSAQVDTGSFTGSFIGTHTGNGAGLTGVVSSSYAITSSYALSVPFGNISALPTLVSNSAQISYTAIANVPAGIVSSSAQVNTGSFTGSFTGNLIGTVANATSASFATTASAATSITFVPATASFALTAGTTGGGLTGNGTAGFHAKFTNVSAIGNSAVSEINSRLEVSASTDITGSLNVTSGINALAFTGSGAGLLGVISSSYATTSSYASSVPFGNLTALPTLVSSSGQIVFGSISNIPAGLVSSSNQISTGTFTGSFIGNGAAVTGVVSSSYALTASFALNGGGGGVSSSFATTASYASSVQFGNITALPTLVSSSTQVSTGSFTGSFIGNGGALTGIVSSSYAITSSAATSITFIPATASFATTASAATSITFIPATASFALSAGTSGGGVSGTGTAGNYAKFTGTSAIGNAALSEVGNRVEVSASLDVTGSVNATSFTGTGAGITGVISSSYALSSSLAASSLSSSYFSGSVVFPNGLNVTGAVTASSGFNGDGSNITGVVSSSFATTASAATSITFIPTSASYAITASFALNGGGAGGGVTGTGTSGNYAKFTGTSAIGNAVVSEVNSRVEVSGSMDVTGSVNATTLTGAGSGVTGVISSSYATTSSFASLAATGSYFSGTAGFPNGLVVTGSVTASVGFNGDGSNITNIQYSKISGLPTLVSSSGQISYAGLTGIPTGIVSSSVQINTGSFTGSFVGSHTGIGSGLTGVVTASYALSAGATGGGVNGSGVTGNYAKFSAPTSLTQAAISEIGPVVEVSASMGITGSVTSSLGILAPNTNHAWGKILINANGSASLQQNYGISGFTTIQTGSWTITWSVPFSNANYCVQLTSEIIAGAFAVASTRTMYIAAGSQSLSSMSVLCLDDTATTHLLKNPDAFHISAWGV